MKLNKEEIIFQVEKNTLPKDFERLEEKENPNCLRCSDDISIRQLRKDNVTLCHDCENRLEELRGDLEFIKALKGGKEKALELSDRMIKAKKQQLNNC